MTSFGGAGLAPKTMEEFRKRIAQQYGDLALEFEVAYGVQSEADIVAATLAAGRDTTFSSHMRNWARMTVAAGSRAYLYYFSYAPPSPRRAELKAFHAGELPYVFNIVPSSDPREAGFTYSDVDRRIADAMSSYWVNFVTTGDPNGKGLQIWPEYEPDTEPYLEVANPIKTGTHLLKAELDFLEKALARRQ